MRKSEKESVGRTDENTGKIKGLLSRLGENRKIILTLLASLGLHMGGAVAFVPDARAAASSEWSEMERKVRKITTGLFGEKEYKEALAKADREKIELNHFVFAEERFSLGIGEAESLRAIETNESLIEKYKPIYERLELGDSAAQLDFLYELSKEKGRYDPNQASLTDLYNKKMGNCVSRAKFFLSILPRIAPKMPLKIIHYAPNKDKIAHVAVIAQVSGHWYELEDVPKALGEKELATAVTHDPRAVVSAYLGEKVEVAGGESAKGVEKSGIAESSRGDSIFGSLALVDAKGNPIRPVTSFAGTTKPESTEQYEMRQKMTYGQAQLASADSGQIPPDYLSRLEKPIEMEFITNGEIKKSVEGINVDTSKVEVDYSLHLNDALKAAKYDIEIVKIPKEKFPSARKGKETVDISLVGFGRELTTEGVLAELDSRGFRPATIRELLALSASHPDIHQMHSVVALGTRWLDTQGGPGSPDFGVAGGRSFNFFYLLPNMKWGTDSRFVAVHK